MKRDLNRSPGKKNAEQNFTYYIYQWYFIIFSQLFFLEPITIKAVPFR